MATRRERRAAAAKPARASGPSLTPYSWPLALAAIFVVAWGWRALYLARLSHTVLAGSLTEDARIYWEWSALLIRHGVLGRNPFYFGPLYPYALVPIRLAFGDSIGAVLQIHALWGAAAVVLLADAARRLTRPAIGLAVGVVIALHPMAVFFDGLVLMESLLFFLESLLLWWVVRAGAVPLRAAALFVSGLLIAILAEGRASAAALLLPAALFLLPWRATPSPRPAHEASSRARASSTPSRLGRSAMALVAGFALVALPVAVRTLAVSHEWIPFTYNFGFNLYAGNNPEATGSFTSITGTHLISPEGRLLEDGAIEADGRAYLRQVEGVTLGARASSDYWAAKAWRWIGAHPRRALELSLRKLRMMWSRREYPQIENAEEYRLVAGPLGLPWLGSFAFLGALALPGLVLAWGRGRAARFVAGYVVVLTLTVVPFFVVDRYRHHLIPGVALLAAITLERAWELVARRDARRALVLGLGILLGAAVTWLPAPALSQRKLAWGLASDLGTRWLDRGRADLAVRDFAEAVRIEQAGRAPRGSATLATERADLYINYGRALSRLGRDAEALAWYERAVAVAPDRAPAIRALADACLRLGQQARADSLYAALGAKVGGEGLALEGRGWSAAQSGRLDEAAALFGQAVRLDPNLESAWGALIRAQVQRGNRAAAESTLARARAAGMGPAALHAHEALVDIMAGRRAAAETALAEVPESAVASDPVLADVVGVVRRALGKAP